ncbi:MAG: DUF1707 domain-containing protein [Gemmatimonadaceae bacterium]|nr:DUF1707 domain-containing protein [Gemmatimonadaceae bacterium]
MSLELERERAVQALCAHFAADHLTTQELEARFTQVYAASDLPALRAVTESLPALAHVPGMEPSMVRIAPEAVERERRFSAIMGEVTRRGDWLVPERITVRAVMGSVKLDLREARFPLTGVTIEVEAFMSEVKVLLPPGVLADVEGSAIMGSFSDSTELPPGAQGPRVRMTGTAFMAEVNVETRVPGETKLTALKKRWKRSLGA